jgi:hypothetical protein
MATRRRQLQGWRWWAVAAAVAIVVSLVLHAVIVVAINRIPWLHDLIFPEEVVVRRTYSPEQIQETADDIRRDISRKLREKTGEVQEILATVADIRDRKVREHAREGSASLITDTERAALGLAVPKQRTLHEVFEAAQLIERGCYDAYEGWRAVTLTVQQKIPLERAREVTKVSRVKRRGGRQALLEGPIRSMGEFRKFRSEVIYVMTEVDGILVGAKRIRDLVLDIDAPELGSGQTIAIQNSGTLYQGSGGALQWGATVGPPLLADEIFASRASSLSKANFQPKPGRKITYKGASMDWMYVDRWYCIGPFPNPGRKNLDEKFPPESVVDLDMQYEGKYGVLRWRPLRSPGLCVNPYDVDKYAIYYFWTEIWSEAEKDYWFALGSDDYGKLWVNGELIWASGKTPHHWIPDRGYRKVKLRKGANQILFKLENAGGTMGFSLVIRIAPIGT